MLSTFWEVKNNVFSNDPYAPGFDYYVYLEKEKIPTTETSTTEVKTTSVSTTETLTTNASTTTDSTTENVKQSELPNTGVEEIPTVLLGIVSLGVSGVVLFKKKK